MAQSTRKTDAGRIPGPAAVPAVIEIAQFFALPNGKTIRNVFHGHYTSPPSNMQTLASALFTSLSNAWSSNLGALMSPQTSFTQVQVRDMTAPQNPVYFGTGTAVAGSGTGNAMPPQSAAVLTENVNARGRGAKGRVYLGGWTVGADGGGGLLAAATQTAINAYGTAVANAISAQTLTPAVAKVARQAYTGFTGTSIPARGATWLQVNSYTCRDLLWDTQRRRGQP